MPCTIPPALSDDDLSSVLDGTASPALHSHLAQCSSCRARLKQATKVEDHLHQLYRWDCPTTEALSDYQLGYSSPAEARFIAQHVDRCPRCQTDQAELRTFLGSDETLPAHNPWRRSSDDGLVALLPAERPHHVPSTHTAPPAALRGQDSGPLIATGPGVTLSIEISEAAGKLHLAGQLAAEEQTAWTGAVVEIWQAGSLQASGLIDDYGGWQCDAVLSGAADIRIMPATGPSLLLTDLLLKQN